MASAGALNAAIAGFGVGVLPYLLGEAETTLVRLYPFALFELPESSDRERPLTSRRCGRCRTGSRR